MLIKDSCAAEGITDGRNGYLIDENAESMAALLMKISGDLNALYDIGQNAMDEIYISWTDSVHMAYERYGELHEMAQSGVFGHRKHQSLEYLINSTAAILNGTQKIFFDIPREIYGGMRENFEEFCDNVVEFKESVREELSEMKESVREDFSEFRESVHNRMKEDDK